MTTQRLALLLCLSLTACAVDAEPEPAIELIDEAPTAGAPARPLEAPAPPTADDLARLAALPADTSTGPSDDLAALQAVQIEGEAMTGNVPSGVYSTPYAVYGGYQARVVFANGDIGQWYYHDGGAWRGVSVAAQGSWCVHGYPTMQVYLYNQAQNAWFWGSGAPQINAQLAGDGPRYFPYWMGTPFVPAGWTYVLIRMGNDSATASCDANLAVDYAAIW